MPVSEARYRQVALEDPEGKWELVCGHLIAKPAMTTEHEQVARKLARQLILQLSDEEYLVDRDSPRLRVHGGNYRLPDVCVIPVPVIQRRLREYPAKLEEYEEPMPLVVEVWSPSTAPSPPGAVNQTAATPNPRTPPAPSTRSPSPTSRSISPASSIDPIRGGVMSGHKKWRELRAERQNSPEYRAAYERTGLAYEIGRKVWELREARGISQAELAQRVASTRSVIARLEAGDIEPRFETLQRVASALDSELVVDLRPRESRMAAPG
jgi:DNA-binding XRE family transcriptional regulator